ncbi:MAG: NUDIX domain-containing protein, partial [Halioglobus sp.]|nr:NUDIX domain-containing protein [Halioglobus sp.]
MSLAARDAIDGDVPAPLRSATVAVLRDAAAGPEVLLVLRHSKASFGANYAFPGGVHEDVDAQVADLCDGCTEQLACAQLDVTTQGLEYYSAAIRELFEETGVLLARRRGTSVQSSLIDTNAYDMERDDVHSGALSWREFL